MARQGWRRRDLAYHEAGHWVADERGGVAHPGMVSIVPRGDSAGRSHSEELTFPVGQRPTRAMRSKALGQVLALCAGYAAAVRAGQPRRVARLGARSDFSEATAILRGWRHESRRRGWSEVGRLVEHVARAEAFVARPKNWRAIEAIAIELLAYEQLDGQWASVIVALADERLEPAQWETRLPLLAEWRQRAKTLMATKEHG